MCIMFFIFIINMLCLIVNFQWYSYEDLMSEFNIINLRGRELQVCTFYQPPVSYLNKTIKKIINGTEEEVFLADNGRLIFF